MPASPGLVAAFRPHDDDHAGQARRQQQPAHGLTFSWYSQADATTTSRGSRPDRREVAQRHALDAEEGTDRGGNPEQGPAGLKPGVRRAQRRQPVPGQHQGRGHQRLRQKAQPQHQQHGQHQARIFGGTVQQREQRTGRQREGNAQQGRTRRHTGSTGRSGAAPPGKEDIGVHPLSQIKAAPLAVCSPVARGSEARGSGRAVLHRQVRPAHHAHRQLAF
jgi:hypothetical protein